MRPERFPQLLRAGTHLPECVPGLLQLEPPRINEKIGPVPIPPDGLKIVHIREVLHQWLNIRRRHLQRPGHLLHREGSAVACDTDIVHQRIVPEPVHIQIQGQSVMAAPQAFGLIGQCFLHFHPHFQFFPHLRQVPADGGGRDVQQLRDLPAGPVFVVI